MFLSAEKYPFLHSLEKNREIILNEFLSYMYDIESSTLQAKDHLKSCFSTELVRSFCVPVFTSNSLYEGQATNGLYNPTYVMPEDNFLQNREILNKLFNIYYREENHHLAKHFNNTAEYIKKIPKLLQCMFVVLKDGCSFSEHTHDILLVYWLKLNNNNGNLSVIVQGEERIFNNNNRVLLFDGSLPHSGSTQLQDHSIYLVIAFNE